MDHALRNIVLAPHRKTSKRGGADLGKTIPQGVLLLEVLEMCSAWVHPQAPLGVWPTRRSVYVYVGVCGGVVFLSGAPTPWGPDNQE